MDPDPFKIDIRYVSFEIPMSVERRIGAAIIAFSRFEHSSELLVWHLLNLESDQAKLITGKMETSRKFQLLKALLLQKGFTDPFWERFWQAQISCTELRNKVAHGVWFIYQAEPCIISTRMKAEPYSFAAEKISVERLGALGRLSARLDSYVRAWGDKLGLQTAKWTKQSDEAKPIPDLDPE